MKIARSSRLVAAIVALFSILFMQLAVASYACPSLDTSHGSQAMSAVPMEDMAGCHDMDPEQPSLCHAYGQSGNQSLDKPAVPPLQPFLAVGFGLPATPLDTTHSPALAVPRTTFLTHATAPPLAIRNCCFRI